jgi:hypothetical protein
VLAERDEAHAKIELLKDQMALDARTIEDAMIKIGELSEENEQLLVKLAVYEKGLATLEQLVYKPAKSN